MEGVFVSWSAALDMWTVARRLNRARLACGARRGVETVVPGVFFCGECCWLRICVRGLLPCSGFTESMCRPVCTRVVCILDLAVLVVMYWRVLIHYCRASHPPR